MVVPPECKSGGTTMPSDVHGALVHEWTGVRRDVVTGPLRDMSFVVKDLFDVAGQPTGGGSPQRRAAAAAATEDAAAVHALFQAGGTLVGRARCDALAYGLAGIDTFDGAPRNPIAPGRVPGGSSSGSAVAVAAGLADLGLATDTGGSIRVPAAYCGLYGWRPTYGAVSIDGMLPLASQFDTVGLVSRAPEALIRGAGALLRDGLDLTRPTCSKILVPIEALERCDEDIAAALGHAFTRLSELVGIEAVVRQLDLDLDAARTTFQLMQAHEAWSIHGEWIEANPNMLPVAVEARFRRGQLIDDTQVVGARALRRAFVQQVLDHLQTSGLLVLPAAPTRPPVLSQSATDAEAVRNRTLAITSIAGLAGLPCLVIPVGPDGRVAEVVPGEQADVVAGVCLVSAPGTDGWLMDIALEWTRSQEGR